MDETSPIKDYTQGTAAFVNKKIQIFQSEYPIDHCFKCDMSDVYKFYSKNEYDMLEYSSKWSTAIEFENQSESTDSVDSSLNNSSDKQEFTYTDIGYKDNVPVFTTYKYKTETLPVVNTLSLPTNSAITINEIKNEPCKNCDTKKEVGQNRNKTMSTSPYAKKTVTSRFGRKRKVIDYSLFKEDEL